jgi:phosphatidylinositol-3-phosphatase
VQPVAFFFRASLQSQWRRRRNCRQVSLFIEDAGKGFGLSDPARNKRDIARVGACHWPNRAVSHSFTRRTSSMCHRWIEAVLAAAMLWLHVQPARAAEKNPPQPDHVVVAILENHSFSQIIKRSRAPYISSLAVNGALFVNAFGVSHPSAPNYFALFSGSTQGVSDNHDHTFNTPNLAEALQAAGKSFCGYVETGSPRRHNPWESFTAARNTERNLRDFPTDFTRLPTVSFVIPNLSHDMHNGTVRDGDTWFRVHLGDYANWAKTHNSLLILTFDESDDKNRIPTIIYGAHVRPGRYDQRITHYSVLSTLLAMYGLQPFAEAETTPPIRAIWDDDLPPAEAEKALRATTGRTAVFRSGQGYAAH